MTDHAAAFVPPPWRRTAADTPRKVGVEVEFTGISARAAAMALQAALGGTLAEEDPQAFAVIGGRFGDLAVELDIRYAHARPAAATPFRLPPRAAAWLGHGLSRLVPRELITAPLPIERLADVDAIVAVLRHAGATGRGRTWLGSLGLHLNVDPPGLEVPRLLPVLQAYLLLEPWLRAAAAEGSRWPAFLAPAFPRAYARRVLDPAYRPDVEALVGDYLDANPTRDRGLDLLPILAHLAPERVRRRLPYRKIGRRPVLHYRLPQAYVGDPAWSIAPAWNGWAAVERLAADPERLARTARAYLGFDGPAAAWVSRLREMGRARRADRLLPRGRWLGRGGHLARRCRSA